MAGDTKRGGRRHGSRWRTAAWSTAGALLLLPLIAMQFTDQVDWSATDFVFAAALVVGAGVAYELAVRMTGRAAYRAGAGVALAAALVLVWANGAVGVIGSADNPANLMYGGVLAVGLAGALLARFRPEGMARAMVATAVAQALVAVIALSGGPGSAEPIQLPDILMLTGFFAALWLASAWLFRHAARGRSAGGAAP